MSRISPSISVCRAKTRARVLSWSFP
jgi:hypothetical protein